MCCILITLIYSCDFSSGESAENKRDNFGDPRGPRESGGVGRVVKICLDIFYFLSII